MKKTSKKLTLKKGIVAQLGKSELHTAIGGSHLDTFYCTTQCTGHYSWACNTGDVKCATEKIYLAQ